MEKSLKIILIILVFLILGIAIHYDFLSKVPFVSNYYENAVLTVNTRRGTANISLNGKDYGQTPTSITNLREGGYTVELEKITESPETYPNQSFYLELYRNTEAIIDIEIAPNNFKSGHILFYSPIPKTSRNEGAISIRSDVKNYDILINNERTAKNDLISHKLKPDEYDIQIISEGYESLEFPAIVREGYDLNIRIYLLPIPISF